MDKNIVIMQAGAEARFTMKDLSNGSKKDILTTAKKLIDAGIFSNGEQILIKHSEESKNNDLARDTAHYLTKCLAEEFNKLAINKEIVIKSDTLLNYETSVEGAVNSISDKFNTVICISRLANFQIPTEAKEYLDKCDAMSINIDKDEWHKIKDSDIKKAPLNFFKNPKEVINKPVFKNW